MAVVRLRLVVVAKAAYAPPFVVKTFYTSCVYVCFLWKTR